MNVLADWLYDDERWCQLDKMLSVVAMILPTLCRNQLSFKPISLRAR